MLLPSGEWPDESDIRISGSMAAQFRVVNACGKSATFYHKIGDERTAAMHELWQWIPFELVEFVMGLWYPPPGDGGSKHSAPRPRSPDPAMTE